MFEIWRCIVDPKACGLTKGWPVQGLPKEAHEVTIPHTINVEAGFEEYRGAIWYETCFIAPEGGKGQKVRLHFGGVYRDMEAWLNGRFVGAHYDSGFAPFTLDVTDGLAAGENRLVLRVDNSFSMRALPIERSFDWADDGGLIRGVTMEVLPQESVGRVQIMARPKIGSNGCRVISSAVEIEIKAEGPAQKVSIFDEDRLIAEGPADEPFIVSEMTLWHFDCPKLYRAVVTGPVDSTEVTFGARAFRADGPRFVLNGEYVRLCGVEWMPGSNPAYGNAEPKAYLEQICKQLKESNCVFTRFHWQQDDAIYDWCDRHGMLVQEEIPNWGGAYMAGSAQADWMIEVSRRHAEEMVAAHANHPSIVSWGVGNEMRGQEPETKYILEQVRDIFRALDPDRLVNYVSNSWWREPAIDAVRIGDSMWINEYYGTWVQDRDLDEDMDRLTTAEPGLPIVISEFGVCEPAFPGGDPARIENLVQKMKKYRTIPQIGATIHFSLNDYRTQMGEEGEGKLRRRVHGSTDIYGNEKPSYKVLQEECAPVVVTETPGQLTITCRNDLPCYAVMGYTITVEDGTSTQIPDLLPGERTEIDWNGAGYCLRRPNGDLVLTSLTSSL